jgi:hypothetical protein
MSAIEKTKPGTGRRSRVEILEAAIEERRQKLAGSLREIADLAGREDQAAAESLRADPSKSAFAVRTPASELRRKRAELEKSVSNLEKELTLLGGELGAASAEAAAAVLAERTKAAKRLAERERELRREAGEAFAALVERWNLLADCLGERSALVSSVALEQLIERVGIFDREARERWQEAAAFVVEPVPATLGAFIDEAFTVTMGADRDPDEGLDELNKYRARHGLPAQVHHVSPSTRELAEAYPDLRGTVRSAEVSGVEIRRPAGPEHWPGEAA